MPTPPPRYASLDVLRGVAILGTLATNVWIFTDPAGLIGYLSGNGRAAMSTGWATMEAVLQQLAQGKFLGLLTLMFGIGLELQRRSAVRAGRPWPGRYPWRAGLLFLDGLLHFLLVAEFDVLMGYAVTGVVVAYLLATSVGAQRRAMVIAAAVHVALLTAVTVLLLSVPVGTPGAGPVLDPNPYANGSWWDLVGFRLDHVVLFRLEPVFILALTTAMFLLGAHLVRRGVLDEDGHDLRRRLVVLGSLALLVDLALGLGLGGPGILAARYGTAPLVALGVLAAGIELVSRRSRPGFVCRRLGEVGRTALSCYVLQNLVASALCYGWGLGLAARWNPDQRVLGTVGVYALVALVVCTLAHLWLRRFDQGPLEAGWRHSYAGIGRVLDASRRRTTVAAEISAEVDAEVSSGRGPRRTH